MLETVEDPDPLTATEATEYVPRESDLLRDAAGDLETG